jgi:RES domain-containing protein
MPMLVWRLTTQNDPADAFSGEGAFLFAARWNSAGTRLVYTAQHLSLAVVEQLVHVTPLTMKLPHYYFSIDLPDASIERFDAAALPRNWADQPAPPALQAIGDAWVASARSLALRVPSAVVPGEDNVLVNPRHPDFASVALTAGHRYRFDQRLLKTPPGRP